LVEYVEIEKEELNKEDFRNITKMFQNPKMITLLWNFEQQSINRLQDLIITNEKEAIKESGRLTFIRYLRAIPLVPDRLENLIEDHETEKEELFTNLTGD